MQSNVIPPEFLIVIDCRIPPESVDVEVWEAIIKKWCEEAGPGIWIEYEQKQPQVPSTKLDSSNRYWTAFKEATDKL